MSTVCLTSLIWLLLFAADSCWHFDFNITVMGRINPFRELVAAACWITLVFSLVSRLKRKRPMKYSYGWIVLLVFINVSVSFVLSSVPLYRQPLNMLWSALFWFGPVTFYVALTNLWPQNGRIAGVIYTAMVRYGAAAAVLLVVAAVVPGGGDLFADVVTQRASLVRIGLVANLMVALAFAHYLVESLSMERPNGRRTLTSWLALYACGASFLVDLTRQRIFAALFLLLCVAVVCVRRRRSHTAMAILGILVFAVAVGSLFVPAGQQSLLLQFVHSINPSGHSGDSHNVSVRLEGMSVYWRELVRTGFVGVGWISTGDGAPVNEITEAIAHHLFLADLNGFQAFVQFGVFAMIVMVLFVVKMGRHAYDLTCSQDPLDRQIGWTVAAFLLMEVVRVSNLFYWPEFAVHYALLMYIVEARRKARVPALLRRLGSARRWQQFPTKANSLREASSLPRLAVPWER